MRNSLAAGAALLLALGAQGAAQHPAKPASPPAQPQAADQAQLRPIFRAGINYVRVDVIISDKNGNPVADMQASDFDVFEDNKPQKIDTFKLIKLDGGTADAIKDPPKEIRNDFDEESEAARDDVRSPRREHGGTRTAGAVHRHANRSVRHDRRDVSAGIDRIGSHDAESFGRLPRTPAVPRPQV